MVGPGKKGRNIFSSLNVFHHGGNERERLLGSSLRPHTSDGGHARERRHNWQDQPQIQKAVSLESPRSNSDPPSISQNIHKPLPPDPKDGQGVGHFFSAKQSSTQKSTNFNTMGRHERSKSRSPGKWPIKGQISAPYDPKNLAEMDGAMNPFEGYDRLSTELDLQNSASLLSNKPLTKHKQAVPRSASAFSFGSMFKFGGNKTKSSASRTKTGWFSHRHQRVHSEVDEEDQTLRQFISTTPAVGQNLLLNDYKSMHDSEQTQEDIQARRLIDQSPKLQKFFFGTKHLEGTGPSGSPNRVSYGSPTRMARRSMAVLKSDDPDTSLFDDEGDMMGASGQQYRHRRMRTSIYDSRFNCNKSTSALVEPTFLFGDYVSGQSAHEDLQIPPDAEILKKPRPVFLNLKDSTLDRPTITVVGTDEFHPNGTYNDDVSGLRHHPNVMECVEPPEWYADALNRGILLPTPTKPRSYRQPRTRHHARRYSTYVAPNFNLKSDSTLDHQPSLQCSHVKQASDASKRDSLEAGLLLESPNMSKRNRRSSMSDDLVEELRMISGFDFLGSGQDESEREDVDTDAGKASTELQVGELENESTQEGSEEIGTSATVAEDEIKELPHLRAMETTQSKSDLQPMVPRRRSMPPPSKYLMTPECNFSAQWPYKTPCEAFTQIDFGFTPRVAPRQLHPISTTPADGGSSQEQEKPCAINPGEESCQLQDEQDDDVGLAL